MTHVGGFGWDEVLYSLVPVALVWAAPRWASEAHVETPRSPSRTVGADPDELVVRRFRRAFSLTRIVCIHRAHDGEQAIVPGLSPCVQAKSCGFGWARIRASSRRRIAGRSTIEPATASMGEAVRPVGELVVREMGFAARQYILWRMLNSRRDIH